MAEQPSSGEHWAEVIQDRLIDFAVRIIKLVDALPNTPAGRHIGGQILRSGTSPAPNYGEGCSAESRNDFIHKLKVVLKELNETLVWLKAILRSKLLPEDRLVDLIDENVQLCKIIGSSVTTAERNRDSQ